MQDQLTETFGSHDCPAGICVVDGYGVRVSVERRKLIVADGIGRHRRVRSFARIERRVRRLVVLGHSGSITLEAVRWCEDVGMAVVVIDHSGRVLLASTSSGLDDARLRREQALA